MAYSQYMNLAGPNDALAKMSAFALANGWNILENCLPDIAIDGSGATDGQTLVIQKNDVFAHFRSASTKKIFQSQMQAGQGIGLVCATNYSANPPSGLWYDQSNATKFVGTQEVIGVGVPLGDTILRLICNAVTEPANMLVFSFEVFAGVWQHLAVGETYKVGAWNGGALVSGSRNSFYMIPTTFDAEGVETGIGCNRLFSMSEQASTFLRCDVDAAPLRRNPVLWASGGKDDTSSVTSGFTGKILGMHVIKPSLANAGWLPKIPHYGYLQSQTQKDVGRNVNTLNCISVNMPMALYVQRDPDSLRNFSQVGYVPGVYFISMRNVAPAQCYEISYPQSGNLHQAFPNVKRAGVMGHDGFSVKQ